LYRHAGRKRALRPRPIPPASAVPLARALPLRGETMPQGEKMQVLATGKWSKEQKRWSMVVAIRRANKATPQDQRKAPPPAKKPRS